jgi:hypothetical protein
MIYSTTLSNGELIVGFQDLMSAVREGRRYHSLLRHYATSRKIAGSIPYEVNGFFNSPNLSIRTMALGLTQPLTEMSTRNLPGGKGRLAHKADLTAIYEPIV